MPLQGAAASGGLPTCGWSSKPVRARSRRQPKVDANAVTVVIGHRGRDPITPTETRRNARPGQINIVQPTRASKTCGADRTYLSTELNKVIDAQYTGKTFQRDGSGRSM